MFAIRVLGNQTPLVCDSITFHATQWVLIESVSEMLTGDDRLIILNDVASVDDERLAPFEVLNPEAIDMALEAAEQAEAQRSMEQLLADREEALALVNAQHSKLTEDFERIQSEFKTTLTEKDAALAEKDAAIQEKDKQIAELLGQVDSLKAELELANTKSLPPAEQGVGDQVLTNVTVDEPQPPSQLDLTADSKPDVSESTKKSK